MIPTPGQPDESTLRISTGGTTLAEFKTFGYLLDVFFSPDAAHVAINNRRANSGEDARVLTQQQIAQYQNDAAKGRLKWAA